MQQNVCDESVADFSRWCSSAYWSSVPVRVSGHLAGTAAVSMIAVVAAGHDEYRIGSSATQNKSRYLTHQIPEPVNYPQQLRIFKANFQGKLRLTQHIIKAMLFICD
jgi:hypothetical protein